MPERRPRSPERPRWITADGDDKPARQPLTRRRIVLAALSLAEQKGIGAISMRQVAAALEVTPMSLYNHVADKAELLDLMLDYVIGDVVRASAGDTGTWDERLRAVARRNYELWRRHPVFAQVYVEGVNIGPNGLANIELIVAILRDAGFGDKDAASACIALWHFTIGSIFVSPVRPVDRSLEAGRSDGSAEGRIAAYFSARPAEEIPHVVAVAGHFPGDGFEFGLELIIVGLRQRLAVADRKAAKPRSRRRARH